MFAAFDVSDSRSANWRRIVVSGAIAFAIVVAVFFPTAREVASIWWRSQTFAHGLVVLPIVCWLLWGMRGDLATIPVRPAWSALIPLAMAGFGWLIGESASVAAVSHFSLAGMLFSAVWVVWGHALTWRAIFPLTFVVFGVPFGEFLVPNLMNHTADFTVFALRLTGIPVFREGNSFIIPSGSWSVVEACSGIRYLIASVMVGVLFAWLNYRSTRRRLLFVIAAFLVPLVANWLRAYMIVMLGHLSGNTIATGVDHLIYGWLFFGVVILALFWVGSVWREPDAHASNDLSGTAPISRAASAASIGAACLAVFASTIVWRPLESWLTETPGAPAYQIDAPAAAPGWQAVADAAPTHWTPTFVGERSRLVKAYRKGDQTVTLFIAYYAQQTSGRELVQWDNRLVTAEDKQWRMIADESAAIADIPVRHNQVLGSPDRVEIWSWMWLGDRITADPRQAKIELMKDRLARRQDDSAAVLVYALQPDSATSTKPLVDAFVREHRTEIERVLRATPRY